MTPQTATLTECTQSLLYSIPDIQKLLGYTILTTYPYHVIRYLINNSTCIALHFYDDRINISIGKTIDYEIISEHQRACPHWHCNNPARANIEDGFADIKLCQLEWTSSNLVEIIKSLLSQEFAGKILECLKTDGSRGITLMVETRKLILQLINQAGV